MIGTREAHPDLTLHITVTIRRLKEYGVAPTWLMPFGCTMEKAHIAKGSTLFQHVLAAGETVTVLIIAPASSIMIKKSSVQSQSIHKRFKETGSARGAERTVITECESLDMNIHQFRDVTLQSMQAIAQELGRYIIMNSSSIYLPCCSHDRATNE